MNLHWMSLWMFILLTTIKWSLFIQTVHYSNHVSSNKTKKMDLHLPFQSNSSFKYLSSETEKG